MSAENLIVGKRAEHYAVSELLKRDLLPYLPAPGAAADLMVRTPASQCIELRIESSISNSKGEERRFQTPDFKPRPELIYLCVEFTGVEIESVWVLPSTVFFVYSDTGGESGLRELSLDAKRDDRCLGKPFREYNHFFRNRWEPVTQFDLYRRYMKPWGSPGLADGWEDFEDGMMALEVIESRDLWEESIPFEPLVFGDAAEL